ncbi:hypothetical protein BH09MYX1_BH09MYX1_61350 [soil metagenome]
MAGPAKPPVAIRITRPYASEDDFLANELDTLSRSGVTLLGAQARPEGVVLRFEIALSTGAPLLRGEGRVVGYKTSAMHGEPGLVLRSTRLDSKSKALIDRAAALRDQRSGRVSAPPPAPTPAPVSAPPPESVDAPSGELPTEAVSASELIPEPDTSQTSMPNAADPPSDPPSDPPAAVDDEPAPSLRVMGEEEAPPSVVMAVEEEARAAAAESARVESAEASAAEPHAILSGPPDLGKLRERAGSLSGERIDALLEEGRKLRAARQRT